MSAAFPSDPTNTEEHYPKLSSMAIVGHTTWNSCRLWVRTYREARWWLVVTPRPLSGDLETLDGLNVPEFLTRHGVITAFVDVADICAKSDQTHVFDITGLLPKTRYYYALIADVQHLSSIPRRTEMGFQEKLYFQTLPKQSQRFSFGFYSCHDPFSSGSLTEGAWPVLHQVLEEKQALFCIGGGDQMYIDPTDKSPLVSLWQWLAQHKNAIIKRYSDDNGLQQEKLLRYFCGIYRKYYRLYWGNGSHLRQVYARYPQYMIWDDHEIMDGWGSYTRDERKKLLNKWFQYDNEALNDQLILLMFQAAKQVYYEYQHQHNPVTFIDLSVDNNHLCQWDYGFITNACGFYMLDVRGHHDYERHLEGTALLGQAQMQRLLRWLQSEAVSDARAIFIVTPVPMVHWNSLVAHLDVGSMKDDLRDEWEHPSNTQERNTLLDAVFRHSDTLGVPIVFLSGDVHSASCYQLEHDTLYTKARVFNATSSGISQQPTFEQAEYFMKKTGKMARYDGCVRRLYARAGVHNCLSVTVDVGEVTRIGIALHWPIGNNGEMGVKHIQLV